MVSSPVRPAGGLSVGQRLSGRSQPFFNGLSGLQLPDTKLFGTDGIRGKVGDLLTAPLAMQIGYWAGQVMRARE
jgi:phosphoglucosamine mutase